jgi:hypothetical protein
MTPRMIDAAAFAHIVRAVEQDLRSRRRALLDAIGALHACSAPSHLPGARVSAWR